MKNRNIIFLLLPCLSLFFISPTHPGLTKNITTDSIVVIELAFVGDLMCHAPQFQYASAASTVTDSFDFKPVYRYIKSYLEEADLTIGNLETVTAGKKAGYSGYPLFNSPDEFIEALAQNGFDLLFTSNNHSLDRGEVGILKTIEILDRNTIMHTGTYSSQADRDSVRIVNIRGISAAFLSFTYGTNGNLVPKGKDYLINTIDEDLIKNDIQKAKEKNPDIIIVYFHFGNEYEKKPSKHQKNIVEKTVEYGADIIIGSHPHVLQPYTFMKGNNSNIDSVFIAYSLGNFLSNQRKRYSDSGVILNLEITKNINRDSIYISDYSFIPTWVFKGQTEKGNEFLILPCEIINCDSLRFLNSSLISKINARCEDTKKILSIK